MKELNFTTPMFRVKMRNTRIKKHTKKAGPRIGMEKVDLVDNKVKSIGNGYNKCEGVNLYMTCERPKRIPDPPKELLKYINTQNIPTNNKNQQSNQILMGLFKNELKSGGKKKKKINEFMAFRSYYSRFFKGIIPQLELSGILAQVWHEYPDMKRTWEMFAEHYNIEQPNLSFPIWLEKTYAATYTADDLYNLFRVATEEKQKPYVEDVYFTKTETGQPDVIQKLNYDVFSPTVREGPYTDTAILSTLFLPEVELLHFLDEIQTV
ncbi:FAFR751W-Xp [Eremothecium gossypii FDAG1]|nr:FAFR751W-Xp [Eremothecium gossypii FDAG1]